MLVSLSVSVRAEPAVPGQMYPLGGKDLIMVKNFLKLPKKTVDQGERMLARFIPARLWLRMIQATDEEMKMLHDAWPGAIPSVPLEEPASHKAAREILGKDFHGIAVSEKHFGAFTEEQRQERMRLRLRDHRTGAFLSEDQTLRVLEGCKGTHVLWPMHVLDLPGIHACRKDMFSSDPNTPWFREQNQRQKWSDEVTKDPWLLVRKEALPGSVDRSVQAQKALLTESFRNERSLLPVEFAEVAIGHFLETGEKLGDKLVIRFFVQTADGNWVVVGWDGDRLSFDDWGGGAGPILAMLSARTS